MFVADDMPSIVLSDENGISRASLFLNNEGSVDLILLDKNETERARLGLNKDGDPTFFLRDRTKGILFQQP
jgi:hypothetical protein